MALGPYTKDSLEADVRNQVTTIMQALANLEQLQARAAAELSAGTFDLDSWYGGEDLDGTKARDKANLLGALDDAATLAEYVFGRAGAPGFPPMRYAVFLL